MTQRKHKAPTPLPSPHAELTQEILGGVPLLRPAETYEIKGERLSAGEIALAYVTQMVQHHTGVDLNEHNQPKGLAQADITDLAKLPDAMLLAREVRIANNFGNNMPKIVLPAMADQPTTPRSKLQTSLIDEVAAHYQSLPKGLIYMPDKPLVTRFWDGYVVPGKTGVGKTVVEALACFLAGVSADKDTTIQAKLSTSTQELVEEYTGRLGTSLFLEFLGKDVPVGVYYQHEHNPFGHVVIGSHASAKKFITGNEDFLVIDEGHHVLGKKFMAWLGTLSIRRPLIATATPAYASKETSSPNEMPRDLRRFCASASTKSNAELMKDGILNPTRIVEVSFDDDPVPLACELAIRLLRIGHRVGVFCQPGKRQPEAIAELINKEFGKRVVDWIASARTGSRAIKGEIIDGTLQGFTTCKKLGEGSNIPNLTGAVFIDPGNPLELEQHTGRFWRPSNRITELWHLIKSSRKSGPRLPKIIGVENADPDMIIGYTPQDDLPENRRDPAHRSPEPVLPLEDLPPLLLGRLIIPQKEAIISGEKRTPTEGFIRLGDIAAREDLPVLWLHAVFDEHHLQHELIVTVREDGTVEYERWYVPELDDWLAENPLQELAANTTMNAAELARMCDTTEQHINDILTELGLETTTSQPANQRLERLKYNFDAIRAVINKIEAIELAALTDVPLGVLVKECGAGLVGFALESPDVPCTAKHLRRNPAYGEKGITAHLSYEDAMLIRAARDRFEALPLFMPQKHRKLTRVAQLTGLNVQTLRKRLSTEEAGKVLILRKSGRSFPSEYLLNEDADMIANRLRPKPLPSSLVPPAMYKKYFGEENSTRAVARIQELGQELIAFPMIGSLRETLCMTWEQFEAADKEFGRAKWVPLIDFRAVHGLSIRHPEQEPDTEKAMHYRRGLLRRYISDNTLIAKPNDDTMEAPASFTTSETLAEFSIAAILFPARAPNIPTEVPPPIQTALAETTTEPAVPAPELPSKREPEPKPKPAETGPTPPKEPEEAVSATPPRSRFAFVEAEKAGTATETVLSSQIFKVDPSRARRPRSPGQPTSPENMPVQKLAPAPAPSPSPSAPAAAAPAQAPTPHRRIPAHFVDAYETLSSICSEPALSKLLRRESIQARPQQNGDKRINWIDPDDAELLRLIIEEAPIAESGSKTADMIAESFRKRIPQIVARNIHTRVGRLVSDVHMELRRERLPDGKPGKLDFHYNKSLAEKIYNAIEEDIRRNRVRSLISNGLR